MTLNEIINSEARLCQLVTSSQAAYYDDADHNIMLLCASCAESLDVEYWEDANSDIHEFSTCDSCDCCVRRTN